jgi:uncharacterized Fe-S cluster protein YjdI
MKELTKKYSNGEVTIVWQPHLCRHSGKCIFGLPGVFDVNRRPWIDPLAATTVEIIEQVGRCPSGALSYLPGPKKVVQEQTGKLPTD